MSLWKESLIDPPIKKSIFLPNSHNMCAGPGFVFFVCLIDFLKKFLCR